MKNIIFKSTLFLSVLLVLACKKEQLHPVAETNCSIDNSNHPEHYKYQAILDQFSLNGIVGLTVTLSSPEKGNWIGSSGYSNIESNQELNPCNVFHTASLAKSFTGIITLQLIEEGTLKFEDPIAQYLPTEVHGFIPNLDKLTIKHLLQQTSGIPEVFDLAFFETLMNAPKEMYTTFELLEMIDGKEALFEPGEKHHYSDLNFNLLALIIDTIEGDHHISFSERIFQPLGLNDIYYHNANYPNPAGLTAAYWDQYNNGHIENISHLQTRLTAYIEGSDGIIASAFDMVKFYEAVFNGELLGEEMLDVLKTDWVPETNEMRMNTGYSHGFMTIETDDGRWIGHTGSHIGASCYVYYNLDTGAMISVFTNTGVHFFTEKMELIYHDLWNDLRTAITS